jgi:hypothetical protein
MSHLRHGMRGLLAEELLIEAKMETCDWGPRSSLALLVHRVPGPACSRRPDGPQQPIEKGGSCSCCRHRTNGLLKRPGRQIARVSDVEFEWQPTW